MRCKSDTLHFFVVYSSKGVRYLCAKTSSSNRNMRDNVKFVSRNIYDMYTSPNVRSSWLRFLFCFHVYKSKPWSRRPSIVFCHCFLYASMGLAEIFPFSMETKNCTNKKLKTKILERDWIPIYPNCHTPKSQKCATTL